MARVVYGNGNECVFLNASINNTNPVTTGAQDAREADRVGVQLVTTGVSGSWKIEVSNDYVIGGSGGYGAAANAGTWSDITAAFTPAIVAVVAGVSGENQYAQADLGARAIRYTFTPSSGTGTAQAIGCMKAFS